MKRSIALVLALGLVFTLFACKKDPVTVTHGEQNDPLAALSAEELYQTALTHQSKMAASSYQTTVLAFGEERDLIKTARVRSGYDGFRYARTSSVRELYFSGDTASFIGTEGAFRAPASSRSFQGFLDVYEIPVIGLAQTALSDFSREDNRVSYQSTDAALLARFARLEIPMGENERVTFRPQKLTGTATVSRAGTFSAEEIHLTGTTVIDAEEKELTVSLYTTLLKESGGEITMPTPPEDTAFIEVADLAMPMRLDTAFDAAASQAEIAVTAVSSERITLADRTLSLDRSVQILQNASGAYESVQTLRRGAEESVGTMTQILLNGTERRTALYNAETAEVLSDESVADSARTLWPQDGRGFLLSLADLASITFAGETDSDTFSFTLKSEAIQRQKDALTALFPETQGLAEPAFFTGSGSVNVKNGTLGSLTFSYQSGFASGTLTLTVQQTENVVLPEWQTPVADDPASLGGDTH